MVSIQLIWKEICICYRLRVLTHRGYMVSKLIRSDVGENSSSSACALRSCGFSSVFPKTNLWWGNVERWGGARWRVCSGSIFLFCPLHLFASALGHPWSGVAQCLPGKLHQLKILADVQVARPKPQLCHLPAVQLQENWWGSLCLPFSSETQDGIGIDRLWLFWGGITSCVREGKGSSCKQQASVCWHLLLWPHESISLFCLQSPAFDIGGGRKLAITI
jgi:hypothetical protein